jgi:hypothetical protein
LKISWNIFYVLIGGLKAAMKMNAAWHTIHKMPKNATLNERINWHLAHLKNCSCRTEMQSKVADEIKKYIDKDKGFKYNI